MILFQVVVILSHLHFKTALKSFFDVNFFKVVIICSPEHFIDRFFMDIDFLKTLFFSYIGIYYCAKINFKVVLNNDVLLFTLPSFLALFKLIRSIDIPPPPQKKKRNDANLMS